MQALENKNNISMKNKYFFRTGITFLLSCLISAGIFGQVLVVGSLKSGKPQVTDLAAATTALKGGLPSTALVSNVYIAQEPESRKYFLFGQIGNASITGKAIELKPDGEILRAAGGPGIEVTCSGFKCSVCIPKISGTKVRCVCEDTNKPEDFQCDMTSKLIISIW
jgi:hypothetical protein